MFRFVAFIGVMRGTSGSEIFMCLLLPEPREDQHKLLSTSQVNAAATPT